MQKKSRFTFEVQRGVSLEITEEELAKLERRSAAAKKRSETMRLKREAAEAARLAKPPVSLEDAYYRHWRTCPHPKYSEGSKRWIQENPWFEFEGKRWQRRASFMRSNSGKTTSLRSVTYFAEDGEKVTEESSPLNRRNDPDRNWGLPE